MNAAGANEAAKAALSEASQAMHAPQRERYWEEATTEDKIERLRDELARACALIQQQSKIIVNLGMHAHSADGRLLVPMAETLHTNQALGVFAHDNGIPHRLRREYERR